MTKNWYETVDAKNSLKDISFLTVLFGRIKVKIFTQLMSFQSELEVLQASVDAMISDVIVITQACDLENNKVDNIIICPHFSLYNYKQDWEEAMKNQGQNPSAKAWRRLCDDIKDGYMWNLTMLNEYRSEIFSMEHRVVDFHEIYTIPRHFLEQRGQPRLRLLPPYREHFSQAFARYFMRVALPVGVRKIW